MKTKVKSPKSKERYVIVGNQSYGLYCGFVSATDEEIIETKSVRMRECRHVCRWYGKTGGITSLAASGPCGPNASQSRIGAPAPSALLTGVVNVLDCTPEAKARLDAVEAS